MNTDKNSNIAVSCFTKDFVYTFELFAVIHRSLILLFVGNERQIKERIKIPTRIILKRVNPAKGNDIDFNILFLCFIRSYSSLRSVNN